MRGGRQVKGEKGNYGRIKGIKKEGRGMNK